MSSNNLLDPATSGQYIASNASYVKINYEGVTNLCEEVLSSLETGKLQIPNAGGGDIHTLKHHPRAIDWIFVTDALKFCFWSNKKQGWSVEGQTGYFALEAALHRAIKEGKDFTNPEFYSKITKKELKHILRSDTIAEIPRINQRLNILHEIGVVLLQKYKGTFETCITESRYNAEELLRIVVKNFPSFRDEAEYKGKKVSFYKRAQVLVSHLVKLFEEKSQSTIDGIDKLTMFADYRVPQVLCYFGVLIYSEELLEKLLKNTLLPNGSPEEVEIRGCSIHAVELLKKCLKEKVLENNFDSIEAPNSVLLDYYLWCYRKKYAKKLINVPFHKTLGIYY